MKKVGLLNCIFLLMIFLGVFLGFLPTIIYYVAYYPGLKSLQDSDVYLYYGIRGDFAVNKVFLKDGVAYLMNSTIPVNSTTPIGLEFGYGTVVLRRFNGSCFRYESYIPYSIILWGGGIVNGTAMSRGLVCNGSLVYRLLLPKGRERIVFPDLDVRLNDTRSLPVTFEVLSVVNRPFYPVVYNVRLVGREDYDYYLYYWELEDGRLLLVGLTTSYHSQRGRGSFVADMELLRTLFSGEPRVRSLFNVSTGDYVLNLTLEDDNVRFANDVVKRIILDSVFTFFPLNVVLVGAGFVGLVLVRRRVIR